VIVESKPQTHLRKDPYLVGAVSDARANTVRIGDAVDGKVAELPTKVGEQDERDERWSVVRPVADGAATPLGSG